MEMGIGFLIGVLAGALVVIVVAVIVGVSRRALRKREVAPSAPAPAPAAAAAMPAKNGTAVRADTKMRAKSVTQPVPKRGNTTHTMIVAEVENRDKVLNKNIEEVRALMLQLASVIKSTETASGEAAEAFSTARKTIDGMSDDSDILTEARQLLVDEIDRVLQSNAKLHKELDKANQGIAEQRRQIEELRVQARIDALIRIPNRAAFDERLREYISLLERTNLVFTLLLLDIDHFKRINDVFGHVNGDRILRGVAARIADSVRNNDFAARYGGEEFAVIFPGTMMDEATAVAERVRQDISKTNFRMDDENIKMTISGGVAECRKGMGPEQIIAAADAALYEAKRGGRNRLCKHGENGMTTVS
ncbi:MAG: GGDEF domain-containing protein [Planctomycetaceae bacterium]|nr:GGDEF domain-containing protein [Planctomycetaceae bacterium]